MKHGPLALIEEGMPVVVLAPRDNYYKKTISNMQEVIARGAKVLLITNKSKDEIISENIWERHLFTHGDKTAIIWEPNDINEKSIHISYKELFERTCQFSNALEAKGIEKGDRVIIYMPMIPEAAIAMLACARFGAVHSVVFAGFSSTALADRINDCKAKMILTSDGNYRGAKNIPVKAVVDEALGKTTSVEKVIVCKRTDSKVQMKSGRDLWWHEIIQGQSKTTSPLFN